MRENEKKNLFSLFFYIFALFGFACFVFGFFYLIVLAFVLIFLDFRLFFTYSFFVCFALIYNSLLLKNINGARTL